MKELDAFIESNPDPRELKRAIAVRMTLRGHPHREIMNILQVCSGFISKWKRAFIINGIEGIKLGYQGFICLFRFRRKRTSYPLAKREK